MTEAERAAIQAAIDLAQDIKDTLAPLLEPTPPDPPDPPDPPPELPEDPTLAARTSGVAPLAVFFDSGAQGADFREKRFRWDFGDPESGTWMHSGQSRNAETGPVAGHLYERPGVYTAKLNNERKVTITVEDPDVVFAGEKTVCFSVDGDFDGAPAGALRIQTTSLAEAASHLAAGKRLLFRRGETWQGGSTSFGGQLAGPGIIGTFGNGVRPLINTTATLFTPRWSDWRIMDLEVLGPGSGDTRGLRTTGYCEQVTVLRCRAGDTKSGWIFSTSQLGTAGPLYDQCAIIDSAAWHLVGGQGGNGSMFAGRRALFLGNTYDDMQGVEHVMRLPWIQAGVIAHSYLGRPAETKHCIKLHGPPFTGSGLGNGQWTERVHIHSNTLRGGLAAWPFACGPEDNHTDQRVRDVVIERCRVEAGPKFQVAFYLSGVGILARNNEIVGTGGSGCTGFWVNRRGAEPVPDQVKLLHNTVYTADPDRFVLASISAGSTGVEVRNNLGSAPNSTQKQLVSGVAVDVDNYLEDAPGFVDPPDDLSLDPNAPALTGALLPEVWDDMLGMPRDPVTVDAGAHES